VLLEEEDQAPLLLDCGPDWREQMEARGMRSVSQALITHAHFDHIGGLTEWADACRWQERSGKLYAPREVIGEIEVRFPWIGKQLSMIANDEGMTYGSWRIVPWRVNHGKNGYSYAYRFENRQGRGDWAYCSDSIQLTGEQKAPLFGLSLLVLGTSFAVEPFAMETRSVYDMSEGLELARETKPTRTIFTHLSHDIDVRKDYGLPSNVALAASGLSLSL
jgi:phosphoribosyl 1,2-cyclic phosphate phosphodiesterase